MNREIKFRAKNIETINGKTNVFFIGYLVKGSSERYYIARPYCADIEVDKKTIGQFTGLKDKKGNEIYEGDVLQTRSGIGYMVFDNCGYAIKSSGSEAVDYEFSAFYTECEIIGNIYDNPEFIS